jgi:hypothetical protein
MQDTDVHASALLIDWYQGQADHALAQMQQARQEYDSTHESDWLDLALEWELRAALAMEQAEQLLEAL